MIKLNIQEQREVKSWITYDRMCNVLRDKQHKKSSKNVLWQQKQVTKK